MKGLAASVLAILVMVSGVSPGQVYEGFDSCSGAYGSNGWRLYFDETVMTGCGGIIESPMFFAMSSTATPSVYLVLINPSTASLNLWQCDFRMEGQGEVAGSYFYGNPTANLGTEDTYVVFFNDPMPLLEDHVPLARFDLLLEEGTNPEGMPFGMMEFYLGPATGEGQTQPGIYSPDDVFHPGHTLTSAYHGFEGPCMTMNTNEGVTDQVSASWDRVKTLYR